MKDQLKEEVKDNSESHITQESSKNIFGFDVINIKKEKDETNFESNTATAFDEEQEAEKKSSKIKSNSGLKKPHECKVCNKRFEYNCLLTRHMRSHIMEEPYECSDCNKKFSLLLNMQRHKKRHEINRLKPISCEICHKSYPGRGALKLHMNIHTRKKFFKCSECDKEFLRMHTLKTHLLTHKTKKLKFLQRVFCEICQKSVKKGGLKLHMYIHTRKKLFKCSECDKEFLWKHNFQTHLRTHKKQSLKQAFCEICQKSFATTGALKLHMNMHTREKLFKCSECDKEFLWEVNFQRHLRIHKKQSLKERIEKPHQCELCNKKFIHRISLINHAGVHTGERPFECSKCGKKYTLKSTLKAHMQIHIKKRVFCEICQKSCRSTGALKSHMNKHTRENVFKCSECDREFFRKEQLKRHLLIHKKDELKRVFCEICQKSFGSTAALKSHMNTHTRENVFKCSDCDREFLRKEQLLIHNKRHMLIHNKDEKRVFCEICQKSCGSTAALKSHMNTHTRENVFKCSECDREFLRKEHFKRHLLIHNKDELKPFSCEICHKSFGRKYGFEAHMNIHTREKVFKCSKCDKELLRKDHLKKHLLTHNKEKLKEAIEKPHQCEHCDKKFIHKNGLLNHTKVHTGEKPFECSKCDKKYKIRSALIVHMQTHIKKITKDIDEHTSHTSSEQIIRLTPDDAMDEINVQPKNIKVEKIDLVEPTVYEYIKSEKNEIEETAKFSLPYDSSFETSICKEELILPNERV